jgi:hypothetical protein
MFSSILISSDLQVAVNHPMGSTSCVGILKYYFLLDCQEKLSFKRMKALGHQGTSNWFKSSCELWYMCDMSEGLVLVFSTQVFLFGATLCTVPSFEHSK